MSNAPQSVERALRILVSFDADDQALSIGDMAARLKVHKSTASRLAATLRRHGLLERTPAGDRFQLGPEIARLGLLALKGRDLLVAASRAMEELAAETGETVTLSILDGDASTTIAQVESPHVVGPRNWIGRSEPLHACSDGKALLAFAGARLPAGRLPALTARTHVERAALRRELAQVRDQGWAQAVGELEDGLHGVAAPVVDASGKCRGALSVSGPSYRLSVVALPLLAQRCVEAATRIGAQLGGSLEANGSGGEGRTRR
jgi:DNA-binding IclR family transcriptional regulator